MSNRSNARAIRIPEGWRGEYRMVHRAGYQQVTMRDAKGRTRPAIFDTAAAAELAAWRALRDSEQPVMVSTGIIIGKHRAEAEALFKVRA